MAAVPVPLSAVPLAVVACWTRLIEVRFKAYATLGNGSMDPRPAVCTGDTDWLLRCTLHFRHGSKARITAPQHGSLL